MYVLPCMPHRVEPRFIGTISGSNCYFQLNLSHQGTYLIAGNMVGTPGQYVNITHTSLLYFGVCTVNLNLSMYYKRSYPPLPAL